MKIINTYKWFRNDFSFDAKCEHCGHVSKHDTGYNDDNYYSNVVPNMRCEQCDESSLSKASEQPNKPLEL